MTSILQPGVAADPALSHVRSMFEEDRATAHIGAEITALELGRCEGRFRIRPEMCNGHGTAQGGFLYTFADSLFAGACNSPGEMAVAAHNSIHYISPAWEGDTVEGVAITRQSWGRNGVVDVSLTVEGEPIAEFRGTFRVIPSQRGTR
ncbi:hotdog fold thioesterase [Corynebacterium flavescens]|uniref:hotdog fold thioesterase n=1 Tax=Corynebacterium flavescens TaxID=28028 RepID=UPI003FD08762